MRLGRGVTVSAVVALATLGIGGVPASATDPLVTYQDASSTLNFSVDTPSFFDGYSQDFSGASVDEENGNSHSGSDGAAFAWARDTHNATLGTSSELTEFTGLVRARTSATPGPEEGDYSWSDARSDLELRFVVHEEVWYRLTVSTMSASQTSGLPADCASSEIVLHNGSDPKYRRVEYAPGCSEDSWSVGRRSGLLAPGEYELYTRAWGHVDSTTGTNESNAEVAVQLVFDQDMLCDNVPPTEGQTIVGTAEDDTLCGGPGADIISSGAGDDLIYGEGGNDQLNGGADDDRIIAGGTGQPTITGGGGSDVIGGSGDTDDISGGPGDDWINGWGGGDILDGGDGVDTIEGKGGQDIIDGGARRDFLFGGVMRDVIAGGDGTDRIFGGDGPDELFGQDHKDQMHGGKGNDTLDGGAGEDTIQGDAGDDILHGRGEGDVMFGNAGLDRMYGGTRLDIMEGGADRDRMYGELGNDSIEGGDGNDTLDGGAGEDIAVGDDDNDTIHGCDNAEDLLQGRAGVDTVYRDPIDEIASFEQHHTC